jgi:5-methylcytosine-specific restriction endonuclease McrA
MKEDNMIRIAEYDPDYIFEYVRKNVQGDYRNKKKQMFNGYNVNVSSDRLFLFKSNRTCVTCGIVGNKIILEMTRNCNTPHFNLYCEKDGDLILITKDHIIPKSKGGKDHLSNYQTMCVVCNVKKGNKI